MMCWLKKRYAAIDWVAMLFSLTLVLFMSAFHFIISY